MTVKEVMDKIKEAKEYSKFLYQLAYEEHDEHIKDYLANSSDLLDEYVDMLKQMKIQET
jgi:hypothetical protein